MKYQELFVLPSTITSASISLIWRPKWHNDVILKIIVGKKKSILWFRKVFFPKLHYCILSYCKAIHRCRASATTAYSISRENSLRLRPCIIGRGHVDMFFLENHQKSWNACLTLKYFSLCITETLDDRNGERAAAVSHLPPTSAPPSVSPRKVSTWCVLTQVLFICGQPDPGTRGYNVSEKWNHQHHHLQVVLHLSAVCMRLCLCWCGGGSTFETDQ